jgi:predicted nucleic-acid-binding protein
LIAVDTNVVVRVLTRDDLEQAPRARALLESGSAYIPKSVVLETEWVLRSIYHFDRPAILDGITRLLGLPGVEIEDRPAVARALDWYRHGLDFADALHLASCGRADAFATFDGALRRKARALKGAVPLVAP